MSENVLRNTRVGLDVGTMNMVSARMDKDKKTQVKSIRNVFIEVDVNNIGTIDLQGLSHAIIEDKVYILGQDAHNMAAIFNQTVRRPMQHGLISANDMDAADVLSVIVKELIGEPREPGKSTCVYSVPANPIDSSGDILYHERIFGKIITDLGFNAVPLNEAMAVVYTECAPTFDGIGISFGAGMSNVAVSYRGVPVSSFSIERGGDWIDIHTARALGIDSVSRVTNLKEKKLDLNNVASKKKREKRVLEGLKFHYESFIDYTLKQIENKLSEVETEFPDEMPIVISGGTSLVPGFIDIVKERLENFEFPFDVSEVRHASEPLSAVARGNLIKAMMS